MHSTVATIRPLLAGRLLSNSVQSLTGGLFRPLVAVDTLDVVEVLPVTAVSVAEELQVYLACDGINRCYPID